MGRGSSQTDRAFGFKRDGDAAFIQGYHIRHFALSPPRWALHPWTWRILDSIYAHNSTGCDNHQTCLQVHDTGNQILPEAYSTLIPKSQEPSRSTEEGIHHCPVPWHRAALESATSSVVALRKMPQFCYGRSLTSAILDLLCYINL